MLPTAMLCLTTTCRPAASRGLAGPLGLGGCFLFGLREWARCGTLRVPEDRARTGGRTIELRVVVLPARAHTTATVPVVFLTGGPGGASTEYAGWASRALGDVRDRRDVILVDQRGTNGPDVLDCHLYDDGRLQSFLAPIFPLARVDACRERLRRHADLTRYTTPAAADDIGDVLDSLGVARADLYGVSYGSRLALEILRRRPARVRRVVLQSVVPPELPVPLAAGWAGERALEHAFDDCAAQAACRAEVPDPRSDVERVLARLRATPVAVTLWNWDWRRLSRERVVIGARGTAERIWSMLYDPAAGRRVLVAVHRAAAGDWVPLADAALRESRGRRQGRAEGLMLSVLCAEDAPRLATADTTRAAAGSLLGLPIVHELSLACAHWPHGPVAAADAAPVVSTAPVLLLSGAYDPVTPPEWAADVARHLSRATHLVNPAGGHASMDDCTGLVIADFLLLPDDVPLPHACMPEWRGSTAPHPSLLIPSPLPATGRTPGRRPAG